MLALLTLFHLILVRGLQPATPRAARRATARRLSPGEAWESYSTALETAPLVTKCVTATCIIGAGDAVAQAIENSKSNGEAVDVARVLRWGLFGLVLQAPWNHYYQNAIEAAIPSTPNPWTTTTGLKVLLDQFVQAPIFTVLVFYFFAIVEGRGLAAAKEQVDATLKETLVKNWLIFIPATAHRPASVDVLGPKTLRARRLSTSPLCLLSTAYSGSIASSSVGLSFSPSSSTRLRSQPEEVRCGCPSCLEGSFEYPPCMDKIGRIIADEMVVPPGVGGAVCAAVALHSVMDDAAWRCDEACPRSLA